MILRCTDACLDVVHPKGLARTLSALRPPSGKRSFTSRKRKSERKGVERNWLFLSPPPPPPPPSIFQGTSDCKVLLWMFLGQGFLEVMVECLIVDGPSKPKLGSAPKGACLLAHPYLRDMGRCQIENNTPMFCGFPFGFPSKGYPFKTTPKDVASTKAHTHTPLTGSNGHRMVSPQLGPVRAFKGYSEIIVDCLVTVRIYALDDAC